MFKSIGQLFWGEQVAIVATLPKGQLFLRSPSEKAAEQLA